MENLDGELSYEQTTFLILTTGNGRAAVHQVKAEIDECIADDANNIKRDNSAALRSRHKKVVVASETSCASFAKLAQAESSTASARRFICR
jgi:hypothetical protein